MLLGKSPVFAEAAIKVKLNDKELTFKGISAVEING